MVAIIVFFIGRWLIKRIINLVVKGMQRRKVEASLFSFTRSMVKITLYFLFIIIIIGILGIETSSFIALFAPVNESVWEHLKLLFFPVFVYTLFEVIVLFKTSGGFLTARLTGVLLGMYFILSAFFTYTGILGRDFLVVDILIFALSVLITFFASRCLEVRCPSLRLPLLASYALLLLIIICFFSFTFSPPDLPMFQSPV